METSPKSTLPGWIITQLGGGKFGLQCPRCQGKAIVAGRRWLRAQPQIGRSCTYCFKTNKIPDHYHDQLPAKEGALL